MVKMIPRMFRSAEHVSRKTFSDRVLCFSLADASDTIFSFALSAFSQITDLYGK